MTVLSFQIVMTNNPQFKKLSTDTNQEKTEGTPLEKTGKDTGFFRNLQKLPKRRKTPNCNLY
jgi:hypothetical protein